jgi:Flp pilus assembly pilin Flp
MKVFVIACLMAVVIAAIGVIALNTVQEPVDKAFTSPYARLGA